MNLCAPKIDKCINKFCTYKPRNYSYFAISKINSIFNFLNKINKKEIWLFENRGTIKDYDDFDKLIKRNLVKDFNEFISWWKEDYPEKTYYYKLKGIEKDNNKKLLLNYKCIMYNDDNYKVISKDNREYNIFLSWINTSLKKSIDMVKNNIYNDYIEFNLPNKYKIGIILKDDYIKVYPEYKGNSKYIGIVPNTRITLYSRDLFKENVNEFIHLYKSSEEKLTGYIKWYKEEQLYIKN